MANNQMIRKRMDELQSQVAAEKEWWDKRKATIQSDFMKELDNEGHKSALASPTSVASSGAGTAGTTKTGTSGGSEDDTVLVEGGGPKDHQGGGKKKKKGKH